MHYGMAFSSKIGGLDSSESPSVASVLNDSPSHLSGALENSLKTSPGAILFPMVHGPGQETATTLDASSSLSQIKGSLM